MRDGTKDTKGKAQDEEAPLCLFPSESFENHSSSHDLMRWQRQTGWGLEF
jgi:hypothetical protein